MEQVFISYSRRDLAFVKRLSADLQAAGLKVWYDLSGLEAGTRWGIEIQDSLDRSRFFLVVLSPNSCRSEWVEREFLYASNQGLKIVPILYQPCKLPLWSLNLHYLELSDENYESSFPDLCRLLGVKPPLKKVVIPSTEEKTPYFATQEEPVTIPGVPSPQPTQARLDIPIGKKPPGRQKEQKNKKDKATGKEKQTLRPVVKKAWLLGLGGLAAFIVLVLGIIFFGGDIKAALFPPPTSTTRPTIIRPTKTPILISTFTPTVTRTPGIGSTWERMADGMMMVYVPEGDFPMGSDTGDKQPVHTVFLDAFWIDQTEVTNAMYARCVQAGACQPPADFSSWGGKPYYGEVTRADFPVIYVDWNAAAAYCAWSGARLPTEAEWEKSARGTDGRLYPWGDDTPTESLGNWDTAGNGGEDFDPVGAHPSGASPYGALDLAGNVWEWIEDWYDSTYYAGSPQNNPTGPSSGDDRVVRGGFLIDLWSSARSYTRYHQNPSDAEYYLGFRCASSALP